MPTILNPDQMEQYQQGAGWRIVTVAAAKDIGAPVMVARHWFLDPKTEGPTNTHGDVEQLLFVIKGNGTAFVGEAHLPLEFETMLWLEPGDKYKFVAGQDGLEILQGYAPGE